ncbi:hypothetical protein EOM09_06640 [bacterium]|nr:hypothetical protein [bacterium]
MCNEKIEQEIIIKSLGLDGLEFNGTIFKFRCPVCGDSKKDSSKKRGYFYINKKTKTSYVFKCHNCGLNMSFVNFLKEYEPAIYKKYIFDQLKNKNLKKTNEPIRNKYNIEKISNIEVKKFLNDKINKRIIIPSKKLENEDVMTYIYNRKIPRERLNDIFYIDNFYNDLYIPMKLLIKEIKNDSYDDKHFKYDPRIFWFIKNRTNDIIGIQGRSLNPKAKLRYLTIKITDDPMIGNIEKININENVYVTEGFIDSMFVDNCVSLNGSSFASTIQKLEELHVKNCIIIFDNEPYNKEIKAKVEHIINESISNNNIKIGVCLLPSYIRNKGKDLNDYVKSGIEKVKLLNIINENTFYGLTAKIKFSKW